MGNNELNCGTPIDLVANCDGSPGGFFRKANISVIILCYE